MANGCWFCFETIFILFLFGLILFGHKWLVLRLAAVVDTLDGRCMKLYMCLWSLSFSIIKDTCSRLFNSYIIFYFCNLVSVPKQSCCIV